MGSEHISRESSPWMVNLADSAYWRRNIPCQDACPVHTDARGYVRAIAEGDFRKAYLIARGPNPLASMCGRICGAPCEAQCRRGNIDNPVAIRSLKRFITDLHGPQSCTDRSAETTRNDLRKLDQTGDCDALDDIRCLLEVIQDADIPQPQGERVAIIGSGPAGLACAHDLCLMGYRPVIFEMESVPAGMLYVGVPEYRLPRDIILSEVAVIEAMGTEIRCGVEVGKDIQLGEILSEFKSVVLAIGAKSSRKLNLPGVEGPGVLGGVEFLRDVAYDRQTAVGRRVVVIGGGNVAYDAARSVARQSYIDISRTAKRQQRVEEVYLACLESLTEMPADDEEILEGQAEGVVRHSGWGPTSIVRDDGGIVTGVEFQRCLRVFDDDGAFSPLFDSEDCMTVDCDTVIITVGQSVETAFIDSGDGIEITQRGMIESDAETLATSRPGVYIAGDAVRGAGLMIDAIASGKQAARSVRGYLSGSENDRTFSDSHDVIPDYAREIGYEGLSRVHAPLIDVTERLKSQKTAVDLGYDAKMARREASRCLDCSVNTIFDGKRCVLCGGCVDVCPTTCLKLVFASQLSGGDALESAGVETAGGEAWREGAAIIKDEAKCIRCANCAQRCPTNAITMERFCFQEQII
jgi:formate dehydrogenase (NADP+) beta subunit